MLPALLQIGSFKIYSFGILFGIAIFLGLYWWWKMGRDENLEETALFDAYFVSLLAFFVGGRAIYVLTHLADFENIYRVLGIVAFPGLSFLGGGVCAVLSAVVMAYYREWEIWKVLDNLAASLGIIFLVGSIVGGINYYMNILQIVWAAVYFVLINKVRKDFRFYSWWRNERSVSPEGLPSLIAILSVSILYIIRGIFEETWRFHGVAYYTIGGIVVLLASAILIYFRSGRTLFKK